MNLVSPSAQKIPPKLPSGFSLVELLVVIAVIGILAAIIIPALSKVYENSTDNTYRRNAQNIASLYNSARMTGVSLPPGDNMTAVMQALSAGVSGTGALASIQYRISTIDQEQLTGAKQYLEWDPQAGLLQYTGATRSVGN